MIKNKEYIKHLCKRTDIYKASIKQLYDGYRFNEEAEKSYLQYGNDNVYSK
jgi:hypothetical protein